MNKESQFYQVLVKIENGIKRMSEQTAAVRWYLEADDLDTAYDKALGLEAVTEKTTLLTRVLPAYTGYRTAKEDVADIIAKEIPVEIGFTAEGWFCLRMPTLLPKKSSGSHDYIRTYLLPAMDMLSQKKVPRPSAQTTSDVLIDLPRYPSGWLLLKMIQRSFNVLASNSPSNTSS